MVRKSTHAESDVTNLPKGSRYDVDTVGPMSVASRSGCRYLVHLIERRTRMVYCAGVKSKAGVAECVAEMLDKLSVFGRQCDRLHADRGSEYTGAALTRMAEEREGHQSHLRGDRNACAQRAYRALTQNVENIETQNDDINGARDD